MSEDTEAALRILGARDGYIHALIHVRNQIGYIDGIYRQIDPRHVRKIAARKAQLEPLRALEKWLVERHLECKKAYDERMAAA